MKMRKISIILITSILIASLIAGCSGGKPTPQSEPKITEDPAASTVNKLAEVVYNLGGVPKTLDPALEAGIPEMTVTMNCFEGLTRYGPDNTPHPAIAERWDVTDEGKTYTFHLRDAKWEDGKPITASDFEYAWKRILDPNLIPEPAMYSYMLYYIKNAEDYNMGAEGITADDVGVKALNDKTLKVELEAPIPYFDQLLAHASYFPVRKDVVEANPEGWSMDSKTHIGNGPFNMVSIEGNIIKFEKNPNYWDAGKVKLDTMAFVCVEEQATALTMFEKGEIDLNDDPPVTDIERLEKEGKLQFAPDVSSYFLSVNTKQKPFDDARVRKALAYAIERDTFCEIRAAGEVPARSIVPEGLPDAEPDSDFRKNGGDLFTDDIELAKQLLAEAGFPEGKGFPEIVLLYNTGETQGMMAEIIAEMWRKNLGINTKLTNQEWGVYLDSLFTGNFSTALVGWATDYLDPMSFIDINASWSGNNTSQWANTDYDQYVKTANSTNDQKIRMEAMHKAERLLMEEMPVIPINFYTNPYLINAKLKGVYLLPLAVVDFKEAYMEK
jgi:oligopeptide transport system substrate-binding protein